MQKAWRSMQEANPEFAKLLGTAQADAVKNFYASNLAWA